MQDPRACNANTSESEQQAHQIPNLGPRISPNHSPTRRRPRPSSPAARVSPPAARPRPLASVVIAIDGCRGPRPAPPARQRTQLWARPSAAVSLVTIHPPHLWLFNAVWFFPCGSACRRCGAWLRVPGAADRRAPGNAGPPVGDPV